MKVLQWLKNNFHFGRSLIGIFIILLATAWIKYNPFIFLGALTMGIYLIFSKEVKK